MMQQMLQAFDWMLYLEIIGKTLLACLLGGLIGYEREALNRPAGFRTHILVCVGSALTMITSEYIYEVYQGGTNLDPARLGAQVISGIGFLGAGTIIREGINVKGLTTAASLWAVACVGLAAGIGFYSGAIIATCIILFSLISFKKIEDGITKRKRQETLFVKLKETAELSNMVGSVSAYFSGKSIVLKNISFQEEGEDGILIKFVIKMPYSMKKEDIMKELILLEPVDKIY